MAVCLALIGLLYIEDVFLTDVTISDDLGNGIIVEVKKYDDTGNAILWDVTVDVDTGNAIPWDVTVYDDSSDTVTFLRIADSCNDMGNADKNQNPVDNVK